jgi:hypothetical protein
VKFKFVVVVAIFAVLAFTFQNCGGFSAMNQQAGSLVSLDTVSTTDVSERSMMMGVFGSQTAGVSANQNAVCDFLGDATLPLVTHYPKLGLRDRPPVASANQASDYMSGKPYVTLYNTSAFPMPVVGNYLVNKYDA